MNEASETGAFFVIVKFDESVKFQFIELEIYTYEFEVTIKLVKEDNKDFEAMLHDNKDMPKVQIVTDTKTIAKYGGDKMYFALPIDYDSGYICFNCCVGKP